MRKLTMLLSVAALTGLCGTAHAADEPIWVDAPGKTISSIVHVEKARMVGSDFAAGSLFIMYFQTETALYKCLENSGKIRCLELRRDEAK